MEFKIAISKLKMIKRDWILPNLSHFTYTLLYNPFYTVFVVCDILINNKNSVYSMCVCCIVKRLLPSNQELFIL